jgi:hypothetical protein
MRDRLIELIKQGARGHTFMPTELIADYLLENGVIVPPCKVGATVYKVVADKRVKKPYECKVVGFWCSELESYNNAHLVRYVNGVFDSSFSVPMDEFGKTVFLTKEQAEKALAEVANGTK